MTTRAAPGSAYLGWLPSALRRLPDEGADRPVPADLVLGYATGYEASVIAPFVRSLRAAFAGDVALVVDDHPDIKGLLAAHGIRAIQARSITGWQPHVVVGRFAAYATLIDLYPDAGNVLLTDVRDVVFQAEPFTPPPTGLEVYVELEGQGLAAHDFTMKHMGRVFGPSLAHTLADRPCICVGTLMGPRAEVARLCRLLLLLCAIPRSEVGGAFGADQAACNLAVHLDLLPARIEPNFGRVATLGNASVDDVAFAAGKVVNPDGSASAIIHQHDRHAALAIQLHALWGADAPRHERVQPRSAAEKRRKIAQSLHRRIPELR